MVTPSLPVLSGSLSHWHLTTRAFPHLNANCKASVPETIKYVIIGSGFAGSLTAWELIKSGVNGEDVLILEAREAISGASGRNAGHVRPDAFRGFPSYSAIHGKEQARKIIANEKVVLDKVVEFVKSNKIDCDFNATTTIDVCLTQEYAVQQAKALAAYQAAGGDVSHVKIYQGERARARTNIPTAICAYEWPAGSNHPGKLCQWILNDVIAKGVRLWTHCPATRVSEHVGNQQSSISSRWDVHTPRGVVAAETVIHCTNAYAAFLLPQLASFVTPEKAQAHCFVPPPSLSGENVVKSTLSLRYGLKGFFSFNQLKDGTVILGGSGTRSSSGWDAETQASLISFDDVGFNEEIQASSQNEFIELTGLSRRTARDGEGFRHAWVGIIGMTPDSAPLIGAIDGLEGQWICAGFNGHGMAKIFTCVPGLVNLISGKPWQETGLPECFKFSNHRINKPPGLSEKSLL